jgi:DNA-binding NtrC family response regulator
MRVTRVTNELERRTPSGSCALRVLSGPNAGLEVTLPAVGVTVGAGAGCDVSLDDKAVSSRHAAIAPTAGGFKVKDLGSRNGTWIDGVTVSEAVVPVGTSVRVGTSVMQLLPEEELIQIAPSEARGFGALRGGSRAMRVVYTALERAAQADASVLLIGESGTGKELAARAVHEHSRRRDGPFVVFDCGAAHDTLVDSDLFGHVRGAFTGAHEARPGAFALAHGGTLFLDEIGDLPVALQPKLLRMLETGEVRPLGARKGSTYDVRVVAATHHDLFEEASRGSFRGDLYYRLAVVEVHLPPLRRRREDIPDLLQHFLAASGSSIEATPGPTLDRLSSYAWPGNVRELRNVVARAVALAPKGAIFGQLPFLFRSVAPQRQGAAMGVRDDEREGALGRADRPFAEAKEAIVTRFEREYFIDLLRRNGSSLAEAARVAGVERKHLYKLLERAGVPLPRRDKGDGD